MSVNDEYLELCFKGQHKELKALLDNSDPERKVNTKYVTPDTGQNAYTRCVLGAAENGDSDTTTLLDYLQCAKILIIKGG